MVVSAPTKGSGWSIDAGAGSESIQAIEQLGLAELTVNL
jgi:hypothetical protein